MTRPDAPLLPFHFDWDYICAGCGGRFAPGDGHDYAACADQARGTRSTGDAVYGAAAGRAQ